MHINKMTLIITLIFSCLHYFFNVIIVSCLQAIKRINYREAAAAALSFHLSTSSFNGAWTIFLFEVRDFFTLYSIIGAQTHNKQAYLK